LDQRNGATRRIGDASSGLSAPIDDFLINLHTQVSRIRGGKVADYIPELGKADPEMFGDDPTSAGCDAAKTSALVKNDEAQRSYRRI